MRDRYADFFEAPTKAEKEITVLRALAESMEAAGAIPFERIVWPDPNHAPDCIATLGAVSVGVEVTELVCAEAIRHNVRVRRPCLESFQPSEALYARWTPEQLVSAVDASLRGKDTKQIVGTYDEFAVVLQTDELELSHTFCSRALSGAGFGPFDQLSRAYLLISYDPAVGLCLYVPVDVRVPQA